MTHKNIPYLVHTEYTYVTLYGIDVIDITTPGESKKNAALCPVMLSQCDRVGSSNKYDLAVKFTTSTSD